MKDWNFKDQDKLDLWQNNRNKIEIYIHPSVCVARTDQLVDITIGMTSSFGMIFPWCVFLELRIRETPAEKATDAIADAERLKHVPDVYRAVVGDTSKGSNYTIERLELKQDGTMTFGTWKVDKLLTCRSCILPAHGSGLGRKSN